MEDTETKEFHKDRKTRDLFWRGASISVEPFSETLII